MKTVEQMAREVGLDGGEDVCGLSGKGPSDRVAYVGEYPCGDILRAFAALVMEECAAMCDARYEKRAAEGLPREAANSRNLAIAIRAAAKDLK